MLQKFASFTTTTLLVLLGILSMVISASIFIFGALPVGEFFQSGYAAIFGASGELSALSDASVDSELRFYCVFFFVFGVFCIRFSRDVAAHRKGIAILMLIFFMGGVGRAISYLTHAPPVPIFILLMWIELTLPPIIMFFYWVGMARRR